MPKRSKCRETLPKYGSHTKESSSASSIAQAGIVETHELITVLKSVPQTTHEDCFKSRKVIAGTVVNGHRKDMDNFLIIPCFSNLQLVFETL